MKKYAYKIILLIIISLSLGQLSAQEKKWCLDSSEVVQVRQDYNKLEYLESSDSIKSAIIYNDSLRLENKEHFISSQSEIIKQQDIQLELFKSREAGTILIPLIKWRGFYPGVSMFYGFEDSNITKNTIMNGLKFDLTGSFKFELNGVVDLSGQIVIPLRKEAFKLRVNAEYRLF